MKIPTSGILLTVISILGGGVGGGADANYDEAKMPAYVLPEVLRFNDGRTVQSAEEWKTGRRAEIAELFAREVYGRSPGRPAHVHYEVDVDAHALAGKATRKQVRIHFSEGNDRPFLDLLLYVPNGAARPVGAFLGLNFGGNQAITTDPGVRITESWVRSDKEGPDVHRARESSRGTEASRWQLETVLARGYALATIYYGDIEPDHPKGWESGVRSRFPADGPEGVAMSSKPITTLAPDAWGAIAAWAWGLRRGLDYLETDPDIDAHKVAVLGHSRLGKTALWAGAMDERFAIVISNDSGCGGAALNRRIFGETVERINVSFPHWFCTNFKRYNNRESDLPIDQHELIALMAPRPVYIASAEKDLWADPKGEFLSGKEAEPVYRLLGKKGLGVTDMPGLNEPVGDFIGYHIRTGVHDVTAYDWAQYLDFADRHYDVKPKP